MTLGLGLFPSFVSRLRNDSRLFRLRRRPPAALRNGFAVCVCVCILTRRASVFRRGSMQSDQPAACFASEVSATLPTSCGASFHFGRMAKTEPKADDFADLEEMDAKELRKVLFPLYRPQIEGCVTPPPHSLLFPKGFISPPFCLRLRLHITTTTIKSPLLALPQSNQLYPHPFCPRLLSWGT